jgi:PPOX class probable F420-dependent enzyme
MQHMNAAQWREFVMTGTRTGMLAVARADGRPHVTPVWFVLDGADVVFTTHQSGVKARELKRDPRAAMCVDDQAPLYSYVTIEGRVSLFDDTGAVRRWATHIAARYMGADRADEVGARNGAPGELLARLRIGKVIAHRDVAG